MKPIVGYTECMKDSPTFRDKLEECQYRLEDLETKVEKVLKNCNSTIEAGKAYLGQQSILVTSLWDLSQHFKSDPPVTQALNKLGNTLQEIVKYHSILLDQAGRSVSRSLNNFLKKEIKEVKDHKQYFEKASADFDVVLNRHAQAPKTRGLPPSSGIGNNAEFYTGSSSLAADLATKDLETNRVCFRHTALDYVHAISMIEAKKRHDLLDPILSYVQAQSTFFHQGSDLFQDIDPYLKKVAAEINVMRGESTSLERDLENRHTVVTPKDLIPTFSSSSDTQMEGYLFKRTTSAFKTWNRRWFMILNSQLVYRKRSGDRELTIMEEDLRLCMVRPFYETDRRNCFEVISPAKVHVLQADSEEMFQAWITAIQDSIGAAFQRTCQPSPPVQVKLSHSSPELSKTNSKTSSKEDLPPLNESQSNSNANSEIRGSPVNSRTLWKEILKVPGNEFCCDCAAENPQWASINLGITLCIECSGIHRSLGVHYSKVRSLTLDAWDTEIAQVMMKMGNVAVNAIFEANLKNQTTLTKPAPNSPRSVRDAWIQAKYVKKLFVEPKATTPEPNLTRKRGICRKKGKNINKPENSASKESYSSSESLDDIDECDPQTLLYRGARSGNLMWMCRALALSADRNLGDPNNQQRAALHLAVISESIAGLQYLLLNGVGINTQDEQGKTALMLAVELGLLQQVCLLLKNRADQNLTDSSGKTPLDLAMEVPNADICSLLRISRLRDEMRETEFGVNEDETFHEIVRDYLK